jgi:hypothetical protein
MELSSFYGLASFPLIRALVKIFGFKNAISNVGLSIFWGIVINICIALIYAMDLKAAIVIGLVAGLLSNIYDDLKSIGK